MPLTDHVPRPGEIRRSGRATKGQHTKLQEAEASPLKPKPKSRVQSTVPNSADPDLEDDNDEEEEAIIRCICGANEDEEGWMMISCEDCTAWQHNLCMGITEQEDLLPETYYCEQCKPEDHADLLAAIERGDKPWEERIVQRHEEEKAAKAKKGKKGKAKSARPSNAAEPVESSNTPAKSTPAKSAAAPIASEAGTKRKFDAVEAANGNDKVRTFTERRFPLSKLTSCTLGTPKRSSCSDYYCRLK
jgi:PHD-finger